MLMDTAQPAVRSVRAWFKHPFFIEALRFFNSRRNILNQLNHHNTLNNNCN